MTNNQKYLINYVNNLDLTKTQILPIKLKWHKRKARLGYSALNPDYLYYLNNVVSGLHADDLVKMSKEYALTYAISRTSVETEILYGNLTDIIPDAVSLKKLKLI